MHWKEDRRPYLDGEDGPPEGCCHSVVCYDGQEDGEELIVFGGGVVGVYRNSLYRYNLRRKRWKKVEIVNEEEMPGVMSHSTVIYGDSCYVYGGLSGEGCLCSTYRVSLDAKSGPLGWEKLKTTGVAPRPTKAHSTVLIGSKMWVFYGAVDSSESTEAVHILDLESLNWSKVEFTGGDGPCARNGQSTTLVNGHVYLFGGLATGAVGAHWVSAAFLESWLADVWRLDPVTLHWTCLHDGSDHTAPRGRYSHLAADFGGNLLIFGGDAANCTLYFDDSWVFNVTQHTWTPLHPPGDCPPPLSGITGASHPSGISFFGGETPDSTYSSSIFTLHAPHTTSSLESIMKDYLITSHLHLTSVQFAEVCAGYKVPECLTESMLQSKPRHRCKRPASAEEHEAAKVLGTKNRRISI